MSDIAANLEAALAQARQELGGIQRVGRALTPAEIQRVETLRQLEAQLQQALDALHLPAATAAVEPAAGNAPAPADAAPGDAAAAGGAGTADATVEQTGLGGATGGSTGSGSAGGATGGSAGSGSTGGGRFDPRGSEMMSDGLAGADDTDDY
jgi:hypothetical protein